MSGILHTVNTTRLQYTPSTFAKTSLLYLSETGSLTALKPHTNSRDNLGGFLILAVKEGEGELRTGGKAYEMKAGDVAFVDCRKAYSHSTSQNLWTISWAHFGGVTLSSIYDKFLQRSGKPVFHPGDVAVYIDLLARLYETASGGSYVRDMSINSLLADLLEMVMLDGWNEEKTDTQKVKASLDLGAVKEYLDLHYQEDISLDSLANVFFVEKSHLSKSYKRQFGINLFDYLTMVRINKAKEYLRFGEKGQEMTLAKIAECCGFSSESYMSARFKKVEGLAPGEYRSRWR